MNGKRLVTERHSGPNLVAMRRCAHCVAHCVKLQVTVYGCVKLTVYSNHVQRPYAAHREQLTSEFTVRPLPLKFNWNPFYHLTWKGEANPKLVFIAVNLLAYIYRVFIQISRLIWPRASKLYQFSAAQWARENEREKCIKNSLRPQAGLLPKDRMMVSYEKAVSWRKVHRVWDGHRREMHRVWGEHRVRDAYEETRSGGPSKEMRTVFETSEE